MNKNEYIGAYLDGYFANNKIPFSLQYYAELAKATKQAKKKYKQYKKQFTK